MLRSMLPGIAVLLALCLVDGFRVGTKKHGSAVAAGGTQHLPSNPNCVAFSCRHKEQVQVALE